MAPARDRETPSPPASGAGTVWQDLEWIADDARRAARVLRRHARLSLATLALVVVGLGANVATLALVRRAAPALISAARTAGVVSAWRKDVGSWARPHCARTASPRRADPPGPAAT